MEYTIVLSSSQIKVLQNRENQAIPTGYRIYGSNFKRESIKAVLLAYPHLKWDLTEVYGVI